MTTIKTPTTRYKWLKNQLHVYIKYCVGKCVLMCGPIQEQKTKKRAKCEHRDEKRKIHTQYMYNRNVRNQNLKMETPDKRNIYAWINFMYGFYIWYLYLCCSYVYKLFVENHYRNFSAIHTLKKIITFRTIHFIWESNLLGSICCCCCSFFSICLIIVFVFVFHPCVTTVPLHSSRNKSNARVCIHW